MKTKTVISVMLLLFICGSVVYLVVQEVRSPSQSAPAESNRPVVSEPQESSSGTEVQKESPSWSSEKVVLYYFHGTARCPTCRKFESFSSEVVQEAFAKALDDGRLEWRVVNIDQPDNEHFVSDYQLYSKSIVIVKIRDGKQTAWKNLNKIWELVRDKKAFMKYIQDELSIYLGAD